MNVQYFSKVEENDMEPDDILPLINVTACGTGYYKIPLSSVRMVGNVCKIVQVPSIWLNCSSIILYFVSYPKKCVFQGTEFVKINLTKESEYLNENRYVLAMRKISINWFTNDENILCVDIEFDTKPI